jgi:hypothetical protein
MRGAGPLAPIAVTARVATLEVTGLPSLEETMP